MRTALPVDKEYVKSLYLKGMTYRAISEKTGVPLNTLTGWASRGGWVKLRQGITHVTLDLHGNASERVKAIYTKAVEQLALLTKHAADANAVVDYADHARAIQNGIAAADKLFGWSATPPEKQAKAVEIGYVEMSAPPPALTDAAPILSTDSGDAAPTPGDAAHAGEAGDVQP